MGARRHTVNIIKWSLLIIVACFVIVAITIYTYDKLGERAYQAALQKAREQGYPLRLDEIEATRREWTENENGAEVIMAIGKQLEEIEEDPFIESPPFAGCDDIPPLGSKWPDRFLAEVGRWCEQKSALLDKIDELAGYAGGRFPIEYKPLPYETELPHCEWVRTACKLKTVHLLWKLQQNDTRNIVRDIGILMRLGRLLDQEPFVISSLSRMGCEVYVVTLAQEACAQTTLAADQLAAIADQLSKIDPLPDFIWGLVGERASLIQTGELLRYKGVCNPSLLPCGLANVPFFKGVYARDHAWTIRLYNRQIEACIAPSYAKGHSLYTELEKERDALSNLHLFSIIFGRPETGVYQLCFRHDAGARCARVGLAAERYRLATGRFPETLDQLVPNYIPDLPQDPFDGKPLRCKHTESHFIIYSVGENLADDSGDVQYVSNNKRPKDIGFVLLPPEKRGRPPATQPATGTTPE